MTAGGNELYALSQFGYSLKQVSGREEGPHYDQFL